MPVYYWKRINPGRILIPAVRESQFISDDLKDLAGCILRRARHLADSDFNFFQAADLFRKLNAWIQYLRCVELMQMTPVTGAEYARLQAQALEWEKAYAAVEVGDAWGRYVAAATSSRKKGVSVAKETVAKPPTLDEVRQRLDTPLPTPPVATPVPRMSDAGTPAGEAHRDMHAHVVPAPDPVWEEEK